MSENPVEISGFPQKCVSLYGARKIIGITGGIGSGKSVVSRILRLNGFPVYDCDSEAKKLMESDRMLIKALIEILGEETFLPDPESNCKYRLNREHVSAKIFNDSELRLRVNSVVHKAVTEDFINFASVSGQIVFFESAIIATSHMDVICDEIWIVKAPEEECIRRVKIRNGMQEQEIRQRIQTQAEEFCKLPDKKIRIIHNGREDMLLPQIYKEFNIENKCLEKF